MCSSLLALISCTFTRTRLPMRRTLPSTSAATPSALPMSRALRVPLPRYDMTDVSEVSVFLFITQIFKRQYRDRFLDLGDGGPWQEEKTCDCGNDHAGCNKN